MKKSELEWYGLLAEKIGRYEEFNEFDYKKYINHFVTATEISAKDIVLELGCGTGAFTSRLSELGYNIVGLDISDKMLFNAKNISSNEYLQGDMDSLPFSDETFDIVFASASLHHLPDLYRCASESFRVLKRGGRFFSLDPNGLNPLAWSEANIPFIRKNICERYLGTFGCTPKERVFTEKEIKKVFGCTGFRYIKTYTINFVPFKNNTFLRKFEGFVEKMPLLRRFGGTIVHKSVKI